VKAVREQYVDGLLVLQVILGDAAQEDQNDVALHELGGDVDDASKE